MIAAPNCTDPRLQLYAIVRPDATDGADRALRELQAERHRR